MKVLKYIFLGLLFIIPFIQGLYFYYQTFIYGTIIVLLLIISIAINQSLKFGKSINFYILTGLTLLYIMTSFYGIDCGMSIIGALKFITYLFFYIFYIQVYSESFRDQSLKILAYASVVIAVFGIISFNNEYLGDLMLQKSRLGGTFQYANTYGIYCLVSCIIFIREKNRKLFDYFGIVVLTIAIILTFSRSILIISIITIFMSLLIEKRNTLKMVSAFLLGSILGIVLVYLYQLNEMGSRLSEVLNASTWQTRLLYYADSVHMIKMYPFGTGHLGYYYIQRAFQTGSTYFVKYIHSNILQIILDIGIIGGVLFIMYFIYNILINKLDFQLRVALFIVFAHGIIDFDFEFPVILVIVIIICGVNVKKMAIISNNTKTYIIALSLVGVVFVYMSIATMTNYGGEYEAAYAMYPLYTDAKIKHIKSTRGYTYDDLMVAQSIANSNKYAVEAYVFQRDYYVNHNDWLEALGLAKKIMAINRLNINHVESYSDILLAYAEELIHKEHYESATTYLKTINNMSHYLDKLAKETNTDYNVKHIPELVMTQQLRKNYKRSEELLDELNKINE